MLLLFPPLPPRRVIKTVGAGVLVVSKTNPVGALRLIVPASLHCKLVQVAVPLPAAAPMSNEVVPISDPDPELKVKVTGRLDGNPIVERFPNGSRDLTTG